MDSSKINQIILYYKDKISDVGTPMLMSALKDADDSLYEKLLVAEIKDPTTTILLSVFLGVLGVDRFYIGDTGLGVAKLLLGWATCGIWPLIDIFFCYQACKEKNVRSIMNIINIFSNK